DFYDDFFIFFCFFSASSSFCFSISATTFSTSAEKLTCKGWFRRITAISMLLLPDWTTSSRAFIVSFTVSTSL
uniref:Uncharacterized protein n=1 Tax=Ciona savignyi TaxID=51511 RepID=H2YVJ8_CIOSA